MITLTITPTLTLHTSLNFIDFNSYKVDAALHSNDPNILVEVIIIL